MSEEMRELMRNQAMSDMGVGLTLAPELGTDPALVERGKIDMRRLSVIQESDLSFLLYAMIRSKKSRVWKKIYEEFLNLKVSVGGRGRRDIIRMEEASKGGMVSVESEIREPNVLARNLWERNWKENQKQELGL